MMALLRYAFLKSKRDGSLAAWLVWPILTGVGWRVAITIMAMPQGYDTVIRDPHAVHDLRMMAGATAWFLAALSAFWTFRGETATRSIGAFLFAARPLTIAVSLVVFGTAIGVMATLLTTALLASLPRQVFLMVREGLVASFVGAAMGELAVMISAQPMMIVGALFGLPLITALLTEMKPTTTLQTLVWVGVAILCVGLSAILLERRCAT